MEVLGDFLKIILPAAAVMYGMFLTVRSFLTKDFEKKLAELKMKQTEIVLPIRLQAYERMSLFLERMSPHNLIMRVNDPSYNVAQLQQRMLIEIREEYNHNLSQQVYMSEQSWGLVKSAMEEIISIINRASVGLAPDAKGIELAKIIFEILLQKNEDPVNKALKFVKKEIQQVF
jgi:bifunctional ADP-heptose synthase (sugar kinase/adenylyltransferase)